VPPAVTKVMVVVVENHSMRQMRRHMPKTFAFASRYAWASDYRAIRHPSLPNYIAMVSGSTYGITNDLGPAVHRLHGANVFAQALAHRRTAKTYADSMPRNCATVNSGRYAVRHNPWVHFVDDRTACAVDDVPASGLRHDERHAALPNVGFLIPNLVHDAHDADLSVADDWISARIHTLTGGRDWRSGHLAIVVTADEDDRHSGNKVLTLVASRYQQHQVVRQRLTHYSLTRFIEDVLGVRHLHRARTAPDMTAAFGVRTR
jgi:acid phosphatase